MKIKYFEEIDIKNLEDYYSKDIEINSNTIDLDINFETKNLNEGEFKKLNLCLENLEKIISKSWSFIVEDYKDGIDVKEYISFHLDDFFEDNPEQILKGTNPDLANKDRFLETLKVNRIGIYPSSSENYLIIDWMTNSEMSNYILVIGGNDNLEINYITIES